MESGILFAVISMLASGLNGGIARKIIKDLGPMKYGLFRNLSLTVVLSVLLIINYKQTNFDIVGILLALLISIIIFVGFYLSNKSVQKGRVGIVLPITSSRIIITTIIAGVFLKEGLTLTQYGLIFLIIGGIVLLSVNLKDLKNFSFSNGGIKEAIYAAGIFGVVMAFYGILAKLLGPYLLGVIVEGTILVGCVLQMKQTGEQLKLTSQEWSEHSKGIIAVMVLSVIAVYFSNLSYIDGSTSIVTAISAASPIITTIYVSCIHKEMLNFRENIGMMVIFAGIIVLSVF